MGVDRPDVVIVMTDQQRHDQVGFASDGYFETPHLDAFAHESLVFTNAYSASTTCVPSRNALLTGIQPHRLPTQHNFLALEERQWTIARALRRAGYETALIGKMHFMPIHASHGFDVMRTCEDYGASTHGTLPDGSSDLDDYHRWLVDEGMGSWDVSESGKHRFLPAAASEDGSGLPYPYELRYHPTSWVEREALAHLEGRARNRPMFLVVSFRHPHPPLNPLGRYRELYAPADAVVPIEGLEVNAGLPAEFRAAMDEEQPDRRFAPRHAERRGRRVLQVRATRTRALIRHLDDAFGRILAQLDRDRTMIVFTSDHGDYAGHRGLLGKVPWIPFDDLLRVPLVISAPGIRRGTTTDAVVQTSDLPLTWCELAGIDVPADEFDSESLSPLLVGTRDAARARDTSRDRVVAFATSMRWPGARRGPLKLIRHEESGATVLFDLDEDPGETVNRASDPAYRSARQDLDGALDAVCARPAPDLGSFSDAPAA